MTKKTGSTFSFNKPCKVYEYATNDVYAEVVETIVGTSLAANVDYTIPELVLSEEGFCVFEF